MQVTSLFSEGAVNTGNYVKHLKTHGSAILTETHDASRSAAAAARSASRAGFAKRVRGDGVAVVDAESTLAHLGMHISEYRELMASGFLVGSLPFNMAANAGFASILRRLKLPVVPTSTLWDTAQRLRKTLVDDKIVDGLTTLQRTRTITILGFPYEATPLLFLSADGWSDGEQRKYLSVVVTGGVERVTSVVKKDGTMGLVNFLRPYSVHLSISHVPSCDLPGDDEGGTMVFTSAKQAKMLHGICDKRGVKKLVAAAMDTTNSQPKTCEEPPLSEMGLLEANCSLLEPVHEPLTFVYCLMHVVNLVGKDVAEKCPPVAAFLASGRALTTWLRASSKRFELLASLQEGDVGTAVKERGAKRLPVKPMRPVEHRFFDNFLIMKRLWVIWPAITAFAGLVTGDGKGLLKDADVSNFLKYYNELKKSELLFKALVGLFESILATSPVVGSQERYTLPLRLPLLQAIFTDVANVRKDAHFKSDKDVLAAAAALEQAAWGRLATISLMKSGLKLNGAAAPTIDEDSTEYTRRIRWDDITNAAMALDPATAPMLQELSGSWDDAKTFIVRVLVTSIVKVQKPAEAAEAGAAAAVGASDAGGGAAGGAAPVEQVTLKCPAGCQYASLEEHIAAIKSIPCGVLTTPKMHNIVIKEKVRAAQKAWGVVKMFKDAGGDDSDDEETWLSALWGVVDKQVSEELKVWRLKVQQPGFPNDVGNPLDLDINPARYGMWPAQKSAMPALAFAATSILGGLAAAIVNEEFHSAAGIIHSKLRASITPNNLEYYALARVLEQRRLADVVVEPDPVMPGYVDLDSVFEQLGMPSEDGDVIDLMDG